MGETAKVLYLLETQAHIQVALSATTDVLEIGKKYVPIHHMQLIETVVIIFSSSELNSYYICL